MKKTLTLAALCIIICLVFASCKSNTSITKRHYNNGYYIAHTKGKQAVEPMKKEKVAQVVTRQPLYSIPKPIQQSSVTGYSDQTLLASNSIVAGTGKKQIKTPYNTKANQVFKSGIRISMAPVNEIKRSFENKKVLVEGEREGLSLFWIIILVLLVLWALGFLGGYVFGGLIHLILVVALILFILWLLHII